MLIIAHLEQRQAGASARTAPTKRPASCSAEAVSGCSEDGVDKSTSFMDERAAPAEAQDAAARTRGRPRRRSEPAKPAAFWEVEPAALPLPAVPPSCEHAQPSQAARSEEGANKGDKAAMLVKKQLADLAAACGVSRATLARGYV